MLDKMADFPQSYPAFFVDEENTVKEHNMVEQKHLSPVMILASIIFMSTFVPLSIDLYLPALPQMREYFQASEMLVNMTLISFFLFFSVGIVLFGPISDKYGRKFSLLGGALVYTLASLICATSGSVYVLIGGRILQALERVA